MKRYDNYAAGYSTEWDPFMAAVTLIVVIAIAVGLAIKYL